MDRRLKLTKKQKTLVSELQEVLTKLRNENVGMVCQETDLYLYNGTHVDSVCFSEEMSKNHKAFLLYDCEDFVNLNCRHVADDEDEIGIKFKE